MDKTRYGQYIVSDLKTPARFTPEFNAAYARWARRVIWIDKDAVPGAFQMNCSWYFKAPDVKTTEAKAHTHDADEIIGFFGDNWQDPYNLGAEIEFWLEDEKHIITRSSLIFVPRGMKHCPLILLKVDRPIFHFSTVTSGTYNYIPEKQA